MRCDAASDVRGKSVHEAGRARGGLRCAWQFVPDIAAVSAGGQLAAVLILMGAFSDGERDGERDGPALLWAWSRCRREDERQNQAGRVALHKQQGRVSQSAAQLPAKLLLNAPDTAGRRCKQARPRLYAARPAAVGQPCSSEQLSTAGLKVQSHLHREHCYVVSQGTKLQEMPHLPSPGTKRSKSPDCP